MWPVVTLILEEFRFKSFILLLVGINFNLLFFGYLMNSSCEDSDAEINEEISIDEDSDEFYRNDAENYEEHSSDEDSEAFYKYDSENYEETSIDENTDTVNEDKNLETNKM